MSCRKCSKIVKRTLSPEELQELLDLRPILSDEEAMQEEMQEENVKRFEKENKTEAFANAARNRGKGAYM